MGRAISTPELAFQVIDVVVRGQMHVLDKNPEEEKEERGLGRGNTAFHQCPLKGEQGPHFTFGLDGNARVGGVGGGKVVVMGVVAAGPGPLQAIGFPALPQFLLNAQPYFQGVLLPVGGGAGWW